MVDQCDRAGASSRKFHSPFATSGSGTRVHPAVESKSEIVSNSTGFAGWCLMRLVMNGQETYRSDEILKRFDLCGRVAVITGAGGELCGVMAQALGSMGVSVAVLDLRLDKAQLRADSILKAGGVAAAFRCDVLNAEEVRQCYKKVNDLWSAPDFLINGAGGNDPRGSTASEFHNPAPAGQAEGQSFFNLNPAAFRQVFDLNFFGTFLVTQTFSRGMAARGSGAIVNISSMTAFRPLTRVAAYSAGKAAVSNFTQWLAVHFAHTGVRVNALAPGFFLTEQLKFLHFDPRTGEPTPRAKQVIARTPMGHYGVADDLIGALVWLLSDAARFVTGAVVPVDGGFSCYSI
jgi:NAD(P)-dependent dehydrogenase (short-subunit alcohol dehydrogenase family)